MLAQKKKPESTLGFLSHESLFLGSALRSASETLAKANLDYGESVSSSGGDWALDDPGAKESAVFAHMKELDLKVLKKLKDLLDLHGTIEYPSESLASVTYGSRVRVVEDSGLVTTCDIGTHIMPGLKAAEDVFTINPESPLAVVLLGKSIDERLVWKGPSGQVFSGNITLIDQKAVYDFYQSF
jgi:hypothetical protein